jgi:hypothetical protein
MYQTQKRGKRAEKQGVTLITSSWSMKCSWKLLITGSCLKGSGSRVERDETWTGKKKESMIETFCEKSNALGKKTKGVVFHAHFFSRRLSWLIRVTQLTRIPFHSESTRTKTERVFVYTRLRITRSFVISHGISFFFFLLHSSGKPKRAFCPLVPYYFTISRSKESHHVNWIKWASILQKKKKKKRAGCVSSWATAWNELTGWHPTSWSWKW